MRCANDIRAGSRQGATDCVHRVGEMTQNGSICSVGTVERPVVRTAPQRHAAGLYEDAPCRRARGSMKEDESAQRFAIAGRLSSGLAVDLPGPGECGACVRGRGVPQALPSRGPTRRRYRDAGFPRITSQFVCRAVDGWGMPRGCGVSEVSLNQPSLQPPISRLRASSAPRFARSRAKD